MFVESIQKLNNGSLLVSFSGDENWQDFPGEVSTIKYQEPAQRTPAGLLYQQQLTFDSFGDDPENQTELNDLVQYPLIISFTYQDGTTKFIGSITPDYNPVLFSPDFSSTPFTTKRTITFTRQSAKPAQFLASL